MRWMSTAELNHLYLVISHVLNHLYLVVRHLFHSFNFEVRTRCHLRWVQPSGRGWQTVGRLTCTVRQFVKPVNPLP